MINSFSTEVEEIPIKMLTTILKITKFVTCTCSRAVILNLLWFYYLLGAYMGSGPARNAKKRQIKT